MEHLFTVESIAELKKVHPGSATSIHILGHARPEDGGAGMFHWSPTSTKIPNNGTVLKSNESEEGRWLRLAEGAVDVRWFGAESDGKDATEPIQAAIDSVRQGGSVYLPSGRYTISSPLELHQGIHIFGDGLFSELHYQGPEKTGCLHLNDEVPSRSLSIASLNILVHTTGAWGIDLRGMSYSRFDHLFIHLRKPNTSGFFGSGNASSPYYNVFTACHVSGAGDPADNGCIGFNFFYDEKDQVQSANANQIFGGHITNCQIAVQCYGGGNVFHGQGLENNDTGYAFDTCPARLTFTHRGSLNDIIGCRAEHVRRIIHQRDRYCYVTAQLTMVTGYETIFDAIDTTNSVILSPHNGTHPTHASIVDRHVTFKTALTD